MNTKITPHLWFDKEAKEATALYTSAFDAVFQDGSKVTNVTTLHDTPSGDADIVSFTLGGQPFMAISAGPYFKLNPSISFIVGCDTAEQVNGLWEKLSENGKPLMPLDTYPFSERYGWIQDKYGFTWQLILTKPEGDERPRIVPSLMFVGAKCGKAEEAIDFYVSVFSSGGGSASGGKDSKKGAMMKYGPGQPTGKEGTVMFADFKLLDMWFAAMDSAGEHKFDFNEAVSIIVKCEDQAEIDYYWEKLSAVPESEQCGWLKDKYGVSWQITPRAMDDMMAGGDKEKMARVTQAFLKMKKFDIAELERAAAGKLAG